jgi:hypothetical protein
MSIEEKYLMILTLEACEKSPYVIRYSYSSPRQCWDTGSKTTPLLSSWELVFSRLLDPPVKEPI